MEEKRSFIPIFKRFIKAFGKAAAVILILVFFAGILTACAGKDSPGEETPVTEAYDFAAHAELYQKVVSSQEAYLKSLQLPCGAFCTWSGGAGAIIRREQRCCRQR